MPTRRVQRSRVKGASVPEGAVNCCRPGRWCNPFMARRWGHAKSVILHRHWLAGGIGALTLERMDFHPAEIDALDRLRERVLINLHRLSGRDLACWCPITSEWCHAETLLRLAPAHADFERHAA